MTRYRPTDDPTSPGESTQAKSLREDDDLWDVMACPYCRGPIEPASTGALCRDCGVRFGLADDGTLDLRLDRPKRVTLSFELVDQPAYSTLPIETEPSVEEAPFDLEDIELPRRLPHELAGRLPPGRDGDLLLDLGCGHSIHRPVCEAAGYRWVGLDVVPGGPTVVGDARALPFQADTFASVLALKVIDQVQNPYLTFAEVGRVLEPGGVIIGSVASAEPFFGTNTFNLTPLGLCDGLRQSGLEAELIRPGWDAFRAQLMLGRFPYLPRSLAHALTAPLRTASRLWYRLGSLFVDHPKAEESFRRLNAAAELHFVARKPRHERPEATDAGGAIRPTTNG